MCDVCMYTENIYIRMGARCREANSFRLSSLGNCTYSSTAGGQRSFAPRIPWYSLYAFSLLRGYNAIQMHVCASARFYRLLLVYLGVTRQRLFDDVMLRVVCCTNTYVRCDCHCVKG